MHGVHGIDQLKQFYFNKSQTKGNGRSGVQETLLVQPWAPISYIYIYTYRLDSHMAPDDACGVVQSTA